VAPNLRPWIVITTLIAIACSSPVPPSPSPTAPAQASPSAGPISTEAQPSPTPALTPPPKVVGDLELEMCDPEGLLPCEHQAALLSEPVAATGLSLTYSSEWADGRTDRPAWNADSLGLGGWSLDVLQRYDPEHGILLSGDGSWRIAAAVDMGDGEQALPSYEGIRYFVFDDEWRHVRTVDSITGATVLTFTYDDIGQLVSAAGHVDGSPVDLSVERDGQGRLTALTGLTGIKTALGVDSDGRLTGVVRADGTFLSLDVGDFGLVRGWLASGRGRTTYEYDATGRVVKRTDADGVTSEFAFEASPDIVTITTTNAYGGTATMHVERAAGVLNRAATAADGTVTRLATNADGSTTYTEPDGTVTTTGSISHPTWGQAAPILSPLVETRPDGTTYRVETTTTMGAGSVEPATDAWRTETVINGGTYVDEYDPQTRTLRSVDPAGRTNLQVYDELGRLVEQQAAGEPRLAYAFDELGRLSSIAVGEVAAETVTTFSYEEGDVIAHQPDGASLRLRHDSMGRLVGVATEGESMSFVLDNAGVPIQLRPGSHPATSAGYSDAGRPTAFIPPVTDDDLSYETTSYTPAGDVATIEGPGDRRIEMNYDAAGRAISWTYDRGTASATYAADSGLLATISSPDNVGTSFLYDGWVPVGMAWSGLVSGEVRRTVDPLLQPTAETVNGGSPVAFGYDESGLLTSIGELALTRGATSEFGRPHV
jgi:YD repeat-containing protein